MKQQLLDMISGAGAPRTARQLSEALEEYRLGQPMEWYADGKPEGIAVEMIDCLIRILDWCGKEGVDVDRILAVKHEYNKTRPYRHGGKAP